MTGEPVTMTGSTSTLELERLGGRLGADHFGRSLTIWSSAHGWVESSDSPRARNNSASISDCIWAVARRIRSIRSRAGAEGGLLREQFRGAGNDRQRSAQLVTGIFRERLLALEDPVEPFHVVIQGGGDDADFAVGEAIAEPLVPLRRIQVRHIVGQLGDGSHDRAR
jgi:hypothetical protein